MLTKIPVDKELEKHTYGIRMSIRTYEKFKKKFYETKINTSKVKTYDDFIQYLLEDNIPSY